MLVYLELSEEYDALIKAKEEMVKAVAAYNRAAEDFKKNPTAIIGIKI